MFICVFVCERVIERLKVMYGDKKRIIERGWRQKET